MHLFDLKADASTDEVNKIIDDFIVK
jgi:hypothetical protein